MAGGSRRVYCDSMFRIASISKPVTAAMVLKLCHKNKVSLDAAVFGKNGILKKYRVKDKKMKNITIRHLLQHSAGWDRDKVGDAVFVRPWCVIEQHPDSKEYNMALLSYALRRKLQFNPGTWHSYSNLGYLVLGEIAETLSGQPFYAIMASYLKELHIRNIELGKKPRTHWLSNEVEYFNNRKPSVVDSIYPGDGEVLPQYGGMAMESSGSYGGLIANTLSLLKLIHCMEKSVDLATSAGNEEQRSDCSSRCPGISSVKVEYRDTLESESILHINANSSATDIKVAQEEPTAKISLEDTGKDKLLLEREAAPKTETKCKISCTGIANTSSCSLISDGLSGTEAVKCNSEQAVCQLCRTDTDSHEISQTCNNCMTVIEPNCDIYNSRWLPNYGICENDKVPNCHVYNGQNLGVWTVDKTGSMYLEVETQAGKIPGSSFHSFTGTSDSESKNISTTSKSPKENTSIQKCSDMKSCHMTCGQHMKCMHAASNSHVKYSIVPSNRNKTHVSKAEKHIETFHRSFGDLLKTPEATSHHCVGNNTFSHHQLTEMFDFSESCLNCAVKRQKIADSECQGSFRHDSTLETEFLPLLTISQTKESLARPHYENGSDWYGLGWDVQDDGKSWGHTGGMEGSCGTLYHHKSGLNWAFLLNSWAVDSDLNGVVKCGLCSVPGLNLYYEEDLSCDNEQGIKVLTRDKSQIILLGVDKTMVSKFVMDNCGYTATWITTICPDVAYVVQRLWKKKGRVDPLDLILPSQMKRNVENHRQYIVIFEKSNVKKYHIVFDKTVEELQDIIDRFKQDNFHVSFLDSYSDFQSQLKFTAVFEFDDAQNVQDVAVYLAIKATHYVKQAKEFVRSHYLAVQCVTEINDELYVSVVTYAKSCQNYLKPDTCSHLHFTSESHLKIPNANDKCEHRVNTEINESHLLNLSSDDSVETSVRNLTKMQNTCTTKLETELSIHQNLEISASVRNPKKSKRRKSRVRLNTDSIYWVQITPESFLTELNRQVSRGNGLVYAKFFTADNKPFVSGCWFPNRGGNRYQRTAMSKYGLVSELVEAASRNVHLQCLSEYQEEDGTIYFAAIWYTG